MDTASDIMYNLVKIFDDQGWQARRKVMRKFMKLETLVKTHILEVIELLNDLEVIGAEINGETQVDMVIETLSYMFDAFRLNHSMNKLSYSLTKLIKEF